MKILKTLQEWDILNEDNLIIGGNFNIRIGKPGKSWEMSVGEADGRCSKVSTISNEERTMVDKVESKGWRILNGCSFEDGEGEYTYISILIFWAQEVTL